MSGPIYKTIKKLVRASSISGAVVGAELGNFLVSQDEIDRAREAGDLYCVEVEINVVETRSVR